MGKIAYTLPARNEREESTIIYVETSGGGEPRPASGKGVVEKATRTIDAELKIVAALAQSVLDTLKQLNPGKIEIEFGVELGGKAGIPMVTEGTAKATFKITLGWPQQAPKGG